jgi:two-component system phosphate regulon sensor histidine kinase PhoR
VTLAAWVVRSRLLWLVTAPFAVLLVAGLLAVAWQASALLRSSHSAQLQTQLASGCALIDEAVGDLIAKGDAARIDPLVRRLGERSSMRVTVIAPDGTVLGESEGDLSVMDNHATRPEVVGAMSGGVGIAVRYSDTVGFDMMYAARPVLREGRTVGFVRAGIPLRDLEAAERQLRRRSLAAALVIALLAMTCGFWVARRLIRPLEELEDLADSWASGDMTARLPSGGSVEVQRVASAMQKMAGELDRRIAALVAERNEQEAVLSSMVEGVLAIDADERVMALNEAGARLLGVDARQALGRTIQEVTRNPNLQRFVGEALRAAAVLERDLAVHGDESRYLQVHGAPVRDAAARRIGAVVVLNDVTRLRRLETVRRDFVANGPHQLKTPVTSIKGFLETLLGGAIDDPANARRFVEIAARQADRLGAIIEDLLALSRIDQDSEQQATIEKTPTLVEGVVQGAIDVCRMKAEQKGVTVDSHCEIGLKARVNGALVEQALVNLIDNAVKYSEAGSTVQVSATRDDGFVVLAVRDQGTGIEAEHLPRLFERFYRVDKARSRTAGGTGLGLAIVKHIVQAQGGTIDVQSRPGKGSTFTLRLPIG